MKKLKIYVDTSVIGGCFDDEFKKYSNLFFEQVKLTKYFVLLSPLTYVELENAPEKVRNVLDNLPVDSKIDVPSESEAKELAEAYLKTKIVGSSSIDDAYHVAIATIAGADLILSWNFKHIVNFEKICKFNSVNLAYGYKSIDIRSPRELNYED